MPSCDDPHHTLITPSGAKSEPHIKKGKFPSSRRLKREIKTNLKSQANVFQVQQSAINISWSACLLKFSVRLFQVKLVGVDILKLKLHDHAPYFSLRDKKLLLHQIWFSSCLRDAPKKVTQKDIFADNLAIQRCMAAP